MISVRRLGIRCWVVLRQGLGCRPGMAGAVTLFSLIRPRVVVGIAFDIGLLPVAKSNFEHAHGRAGTGEAVLGVGGDPQFVASLGVEDLFSYLNFAAVVKHDPQFGAAGM